MNVPREVAEAAFGPGCREVRDGLVADHNIREAAEQGERADGHRQRRQTEPGHQPAVEGATKRARNEADRHDDFQR